MLKRIYHKMKKSLKVFFATSATAVSEVSERGVFYLGLLQRHLPHGA